MLYHIGKNVGLCNLELIKGYYMSSVSENKEEAGQNNASEVKAASPRSPKSPKSAKKEEE